MALLSGFYRKREPGAIVKFEADNGVGYGLAGPVSPARHSMDASRRKMIPLVSTALDARIYPAC
jgi:hypothetical protein